MECCLKTSPTLHQHSTEISLSFLVDEPVEQFFRTILKGECVWSVGGVLVECWNNTPHSAKPLYIAVPRDLGEVVTLFAIFAPFR